MIEAAVLAGLTALPAVVALAEDRIYPNTLPASVTTWPAISYRCIDQPQLGDDNDGAGDVARPRIEVNCWAAGYALAVALAEAVKDLRDMSGAIAGEEIDHVTLDDTRFFYETDRKLHRVCREFIVWGRD